MNGRTGQTGNNGNNGRNQNSGVGLPQESGEKMMHEIISTSKFPLMLSKLHDIKYPDGYFWTWHQKTNRSWTLINDVWWTPYVHQNHANEPYIYWYSEEKWNSHSKFYINDFKYTSTNVDMDSNNAQSSSSHS